MCYIFSFREDKDIFFNNLGQKHTNRSTPKIHIPLILLDLYFNTSDSFK